MPAAGICPAPSAAARNPRRHMHSHAATAQAIPGCGHPSTPITSAAAPAFVVAPAPAMCPPVSFRARTVCRRLRVPYASRTTRDGGTLVVLGRDIGRPAHHRFLHPRAASSAATGASGSIRRTRTKNDRSIVGFSDAWARGRSLKILIIKPNQRLVFYGALFASAGKNCSIS